MSNIEVEIQKALNASDDELYAIIGYENSKELGAFPPSIEKLIESGKLLFDQKISIIRSSICTNDFLRKNVESETFSVELGILIADYITNLKVDLPVVPFTVLIMKQGIKNICDAYWR